MNTKPTSNALLKNFRRKNVTRQHPSFFGQVLGASMAEKMLNTFQASGLTVPEHNFFGIPRSKYVAKQQSKATDMSANRTFRMPEPNLAELRAA